MKKPFQRPESHFVNISTERPMSGLAEMSDEELLNELKASGYFEKQVTESLSCLPGQSDGRERKFKKRPEYICRYTKELAEQMCAVLPKERK